VKLLVSLPGVKGMTSKGLKRTCTFLARWAVFALEYFVKGVSGCF
jgi:hypothetical protein